MKAELLQRLKEPFHEHEIDWRVGQLNHAGDGCSLLAYVDSRAVQERLDEVCGPADWETINTAYPEGVICQLRIWIDERNGWVTKSDGAGYTGGEHSFKGGNSDALKRAAVPWGIGRYLYGLTATWVDLVPNRPNGPHVYVAKAKANFAAIPRLGAWWVRGGRELLEEVRERGAAKHGDVWEAKALAWIQRQHTYRYTSLRDVPLEIVQELVAASSGDQRTAA